MSTQFRVVAGKKDERVDGDDGAEIVFTAPLAVAADPGFDATVEFMRGRLKASGHSGQVLALLKSGEVTATLARLAAGAG